MLEAHLGWLSYLGGPTPRSSQDMVQSAPSAKVRSPKLTPNGPSYAVETELVAASTRATLALPGAVPFTHTAPSPTARDSKSMSMGTVVTIAFVAGSIRTTLPFPVAEFCPTHTEPKPAAI